MRVKISKKKRIEVEKNINRLFAELYVWNYSNAIIVQEILITPEESTPVKYIALIIGLTLLFTTDCDSQVHRIGVGFSFASGTTFNYGETGNPGITIKTWLALDKRSSFHIVPSISLYNRYRLENGYSILTNYMFHGDLNAQYAFFHEGTVRAIVFGGGNFTYLTSDFEQLVAIGNQNITDETDYAVGGNLGAGLELHMRPKWDFNVSGKYVFSKYSQFIISVQAVYYFKSRRRAYRRWFFFIFSHYILISNLFQK